IRSVEAHVGDLKIILDRVDLLADDHPLGEPEAPNVAYERRERLAGEDEEPECLARPHTRDSLQQEVDAFARAQDGRMHYEDFVAQTELAADDLGRAAGPMRSGGVADNLDRAVGSEKTRGTPLQRLGYR